MSFDYLQATSRTDIGRKRRRNEDAVLSLPEAGVFCVADGIGGAQEGDINSEEVIQTVRRTTSSFLDSGVYINLADRVKNLSTALDELSHRIKQRARDRGMPNSGSTVLILLFAPETLGRAIALHAGDSRLYRFRDRDLQLLTKDHSIAEMLGRQEKSLPVDFRGVITRAVGLDDKVALEQTNIEVKSGDLFMLCTDGLTRMLTDKQLRKICRDRRSRGLEALAGYLIDEANRAGGEDNISVVLVEVGTWVMPSGAEPATPPTRSSSSASETTPGIASNITVTCDGLADGQRTSLQTTLEVLPEAAPEPATLVGKTPDSAETPVPPRSLGNILRHNLLPRAGALVTIITVLVLALGSVRIFLVRKKPSKAGPPAVFANHKDDLSTSVSSTTDYKEAAASAMTAQATSPTDMTTTYEVAAPAVLENDATKTSGRAAALSNVTFTPAGASGERESYLPSLETTDTVVDLDTTAQVPTDAVVRTQEPSSPPMATATVMLQPEASITRIEPDLSARERERAWLARRIAEALDSGRWGALEQYVNEWLPWIPDLIEHSNHKEVFTAWTASWRFARDHTDQMRSKEEALASAEQTVRSALGLAPRRVQYILEGTPEQQADEYCRNTYQRMETLVRHVSSIAEQLEQHAYCWEELTTNRLFRLYAFARDQSPDHTCRKLMTDVAALRKSVGRLEAWVSTWTSRPLPLEQPEHMPTEQAKAAIASSSNLVAQVLALLDNCRLAVSGSWYNYADASTGETLSEIVVLCNAATLDIQAHAREKPWLTPQNGAMLKRIVSIVEEIAPRLPISL